MTPSDHEDPRWAKTRELLREHLTSAPLPHPDFVNSQVMEAIRQEAKPAVRKPLISLVRLAWAGAGLLAIAALVTGIWLPREFGFRSEDEFMSQVIAARAETPALSVTAFRPPGDRGVVLWIEGSDYIPASQSVQ